MFRAPDTYVVGVDVGRTRDRSAIVVLHRHGPTGETAVRSAQFRAGLPLDELEQRACEMLVSLDRQIPRTAKLMLVIDRNGIGLGVAEAIHKKVMRERSLGLGRYVRVVGVDATGGTSINRDDKVSWWYNVGRDLLTHRTNAALREGTLSITEAAGNGAEALGTEITRLHLKTTPSGRQRVDHKPGEHDDLYMAMCLGFWLLSEFKTGGHTPGDPAFVRSRSPRSPARASATAGPTPTASPAAALARSMTAPPTSSMRVPTGLARPQRRPRNSMGIRTTLPSTGRRDLLQ